MFNAFLPLVSLAKTLTGVALSPGLIQALRVQSSKCHEALLTEVVLYQPYIDNTPLSAPGSTKCRISFFVEIVAFITVLVKATSK